MAQQGWIKLHRKITESYLWDSKEPFDKRSAWIDLLLLANHQDKKIMLGNQLIDIEQGSFITSEVKLSTRWKWSRKKVRGFIEVLEQDKMLVKKSTSKYTSISIVNYGLYQNQGTTEYTSEEHQKNSTGTSKEHQKNTNKNDKNIKNDNNEKNEKKVLSDLDKTILDFKEMRKKLNRVMTDRAVELMLKKLDGLAKDDETKILILEQSIANSWQGIFPLKVDSPQPQQQYKKQPVTNNSGKRQYESGELEKMLLGR